MGKSVYICYLDHRIKLERNTTYTVGRQKSDITLSHFLVSRQHARFEWSENDLFIVDANSTNGTSVNGKAVHKIPLKNGDRIEIGGFHMDVVFVYEPTDTIKASTPLSDETLMLNKAVEQILKDVEDQSLAARISDLKSQFERRKQVLTDLAYKDTLTALYNRRFFDKTLQEETERARRYQRDLQLILIDIDHFKRLNDTYGHQKGDDALQNIASIIEGHGRENDTVARYGGEELVIILPETSLDMAIKVAEKIRKKVQNETKRHTDCEVTISLGISSFNASNNTPEKLIKSADNALYLAKNEGRNRVATEQMVSCYS